MDYEFIALADAGPELASAPFETHARMTQIAMAEKPKDFIADEVLPRVNSAFSFKYTKGMNEDQFTIPETRASRQGRLNEVEFGAELADGSCDDHGLLAYVPERDIREAQAQASAWDPMAQASMGATQLMHLDREKRVADLVFDKTQYPTGYKVDLSASSRSGGWEKATSDPLGVIMDALDVPITRPNSLVLGQAVWTKLRRHPKIVEAIKATGAGAGGSAAQAAGVVGRAAVAELFEIERILVGSTWYNSAKRGQAASYARLWGNHAALLHLRRPTGTREMMPTWGFTAQAMPLAVMTSEEPSRGVGRGSRAIKVSECIKELVSWNTAGYFFEKAVA